jgi:hypothetical protein
MKIKLRNGSPASEEAILALEVVLGCRLSDSFKDFVRTHDGAEPETNVFRVGDHNSSGVHEFMSINEIPETRRRIEDIPTRAYPVAWDECGNLIFIDEDRNGAVFFSNHEILNDHTEMAASFGAFLDLLEPFDIKTVKLEPGQVKRVWVDPEFLKKLNR